MPILPAEEFVFPNDLFGAASEPADDGSRWWVLHTRPRAEKALARKVRNKDIRYFLPLRKQQWRKHGRAFSSYLPLFTSYLFLYGDEDSRRNALETNLVANCLPVPNQLRIHQDLARVYRLMISGEALAPEDRLDPGTRVEIIGGPLAGVEGTIIRRGSQMRFYVEVEFLQRAVSAEVQSWMIRPLSARASAG